MKIDAVKRKFGAVKCTFHFKLDYYLYFRALFDNG
jgi:hypothetical protein